LLENIRIYKVLIVDDWMNEKVISNRCVETIINQISDFTKKELDLISDYRMGGCERTFGEFINHLLEEKVIIDTSEKYEHVSSNQEPIGIITETGFLPYCYKKSQQDFSEAVMSLR